MTTLLFAFIVALCLGLLATPLARRLGHAWGALDQPEQRKVHACVTPRTGGLSIALVHILSLLLVRLVGTDISELLVLGPELIVLWSGALIAFGVGLWDDFRRLNAKVKLTVQILAATVAFAGGLAIDPSSLFGGLLAWIPVLDSVVGSYVLTVAWFVLLINAVNLIDGLDGLAGGIVLFVCLALSFLQVTNQDYLLAVYFVTLAGSVAGFLRYNLAPASIFMGDGGSYYLGYLIAGLSILGSIKSQVGFTLTLPLLAMGVPIFDTIIAPIRRFILGRGPFQPDRQHLHHRLLAKGLSSSRVVMILYAVTALLCIGTLLSVHMNKEQSGLLLIFLGVGVVFVLNGFGFFGYLNQEKIESWLRDVGFVTGLHPKRRKFLALQIRISKSQSVEELWSVVTSMLEVLDFDHARMRLDALNGQTGGEWAWDRGELNGDALAEGLFRLELPLKCRQGNARGKLELAKDLGRSDMGPYTLIRIEHLRRAVLRCLEEIEKKG